MDSSTIFTKTAKGLKESVGKTSVLSGEFRKILKEVDGKASLGDLHGKLEKMPQAKLLEILTKLQADDYIREFVIESNTLFGGDFEPVEASPEHPKASGGFDLDFSTIAAPEYKEEVPAARPAEKAAGNAKADAAAKAEAARAKMQADELARREAEQRAKADQEKLKRAAAEDAKKQADLEARSKAEEQARLEAAAKVKREADAQAKQAADEKAKQQAAELLRKQLEKQAAEKAQREAAAQARKEAEENAKKQAAEHLRQQARRQAEENARREAALQAKKEAEEKAKREAAARAQKEAEERGRREAEEKARREAEAKAQREAEENAKREAAARAQKEAEERGRREAEEKARREAEAKAQREADDRARREAQERVRRDAEEKARREAEAKAQREADDRARREAQERVRRDAEEKARREAEAKAQREAEEKVKKDAEEQARRQAQEQARHDAEENARRDAEAKAKRDAEEAARRDAEARARQEAEARKRREAEEKIQREAEDKAKKEEEKARQKAEQLARKEEKEQAKKPAAEPISQDDVATSSSRADEAVPRSPINWGKLGKLAILTLVLLIAAGVGAIHLMPFDGKRHLLEKAAAEQFQQPVKINAVHLSLVPQPHWRIDGVSIGNEGQIKIEEVNTAIGWDMLTSDKMEFKSVEIASPILTEEGLGWVLFSQSWVRNFKFGSVSASKARLDSKNLTLPLLDVKTELDAAGAWKKISLAAAEPSIQLELQPAGDAVQISISADPFAIPFGSTSTLQKFKAAGTASRNELNITEFGGGLYDGLISGNAKLTWGATWTLKGELSAKQMRMFKILPELIDNGSLEGKAKFSMQAQDAGTLFTSAPRVEGNVSIVDGNLVGVNLGLLFRNPQSRGNSKFAELAGSFLHENGMTQVRKVSLTTGMLSATGNADVDANNKLSGNFMVNLKFPDREHRSNLVVSGTLKEPLFNQ